jgi:hypothetical protein
MDGHSVVEGASMVSLCTVRLLQDEQTGTTGTFQMKFPGFWTGVFGGVEHVSTTEDPIATGAFD